MAPGRLGAKLFVAAGLLTIVNNFIPPLDHLNRGVLFAVGFSAIGWGVFCRLAPWQRWPRHVSLLLAPLALAHIGLANLFGGVSAYSYAVYFVVVFVYVGLTQPPWTSVGLAPLATAAYVLPSLIRDDDLIAALSASVAIPVCLLVGEVISRSVSRQRAAREESERRAELLAVLAGVSRRTSLDSEEVLRSVVEAATRMGFDAAEIGLYEENAGTYVIVWSRGLPDSYLRSAQDIGSGVAGRVRREGHTIVVNDYSASDVAAPELGEAGFGTVVAAPIWSEGRLAAALIAGTRGSRALAATDLEAFELLAGQAGRALDNARRFEAEKETAEKLAQVDRLKDDFVSNISHEFRTPLTVIGGVGATLARWQELGEANRKDLLERLDRNVHTLENIISNLLDFSRLRSGLLEVRMQPVDLAELCSSVAARIRPLFREHDLVLDLQPGVTVSADPLLIDRVLENLLSNAVKHTPAGTSVQLSLRLRADTAVVAVADEGPGIPEEDLQRIGDRFFRGGDPDKRTTRGTGLGLAFSWELLRLHGTNLEVASGPGRGASFSFALQLEPPAGEPQTAPVQKVAT